MRDLIALLLALVAGGCGSDTGGLRQLAASATLAGVSLGEQQLAEYASTSMLANGAPMGPLAVMQLPSGAPAKLEDAAFDASFNRRGQVLLYQTGPAPSTDPNSTALYGALHLWQPGMSTGARLTSGFAILSTAPPDDSFALFFDGQRPTRAQLGSVVLARAADCAGAACKPSPLASDVVVHSLLASDDGRYGAYVLRRAPAMMGGPPHFETWLVSVADGVTTMLGDTTSMLAIVPMAFSPDGALFAYANESGMAPLQMMVVSTQTLVPAPWATLPAGTGVVGLAFSDASTLLANAASARGSEGVFRTSAGRAVRLVPSARTIYVPQYPRGASRYLFVETAETAGGHTDAYDLLAATPTPILVSMSTVDFATAPASAFPAVSDDLSSVRVFDNWDPTSRTGTVSVVTLATGVRAAIAPADGAASFVPQSQRVTFIDQPDASNAGLLTVWDAGQSRALASGVFNFRLRGASSMAPGGLYMTITESDPSLTSITPGIYLAPLP
jgi:hypothetical protein